MINEQLLQALKATVTNTDHAYFVWGDALAVVAEELAKDPARAAAWRDALNEHVPDTGALPLDFPDRTPAEIVGIDGDKVRAVVGKYNAIRLTGPQVNALAAAAVECVDYRGNYGAATHGTWYSLHRLGLIEDKHTAHATEAGRAWLHAEGLLPIDVNR